METNTPDGTGPSVQPRMEERFFASFKSDLFAKRAWFSVTLAFIVVIYAGVIGFLLYRADPPVQSAGLEETPVDVIVAKPPEPPNPDKPKPAEKELEKPATSAPRAPNDEKVDTQQIQKDTHAPKAPTPPKDGQPEKAQATSPSTEPATPDKSEDAAVQKDVPDKEAEALDKAVPEPPKKPRDLVAKPKPPAKVRAATSALDQLAANSDLPDYSFARPTKRSPVYGGTEDARYLAIVNGMIHAKKHAMHRVSGGDGEVVIRMHLDDDGSVIQVGFVHRSGDPEVNDNAVEVLRRASPFPPPPNAEAHNLEAILNFDEDEPPLTTGRRGQ